MSENSFGKMHPEGRIVAVTQEMLFVARPIIYLCRLFGLFPMNVQQNGAKFHFKFSTLYAVYSFCFIGAQVAYATIITIRNGVNAFLNIELNTLGNFITYMNGTFLLVNLMIAYLNTLTQFSQFSGYVKCLKEFDTIFPPENLKYYKSKVTVSLVIIFVIFTSMTIFEISNEWENPQMIGIELLYFFSNCTLALNQYSYSYMVYSIYRRIKVLNQNLGMENYLENGLQTSVERKPDCKEISNNNPNYGITKMGKLIKSYIKLSKAVDYTNQIFGFNCVVIILGTFFYLMLTLLVVISILVHENTNVPIIVRLCFLLAWQSARLLYTIEPCDSCLEEFQITKNLISDFIASSDIGNDLKEEVKEFSKIARHHVIEFHASNLTTIHRPLISHIIAVLVTNLVILMQFMKAN